MLLNDQLPSAVVEACPPVANAAELIIPPTACEATEAAPFVRKKARILNVQYTPDFYFKYNDLNVYIEAKGMENDVFYLKKKMFIKYLNDRYLEKGEKSIYFEVYTRKQLLQAIEIIKNYEQE